MFVTLLWAEQKGTLHCSLHAQPPLAALVLFWESQLSISFPFLSPLPLQLFSVSLGDSYHIWLKCGYEKQHVEYLLPKTVVTVFTWPSSTFPQHSPERQKCGYRNNLGHQNKQTPKKPQTNKNNNNPPKQQQQKNQNTNQRNLVYKLKRVHWSFPKAQAFLRLSQLFSTPKVKCIWKYWLMHCCNSRNTLEFSIKSLLAEHNIHLQPNLTWGWQTYSSSCILDSFSFRVKAENAKSAIYITRTD